MSQERLAADAGIDRAYVSELEREKSAVSVDLLDRIAAVLNCRIADFFEEAHESAEKPKALKSGRKPQR